MPLTFPLGLFVGGSVGPEEAVTSPHSLIVVFNSENIYYGNQLCFLV